MSDIRALLLEARNQAGHVMTITLQDAIDAALAEPVPEPVALYWGSSNGQPCIDWVNGYSPNGKVYLYAAPPSASPTIGQCETRKERAPMQLPDPDPPNPSDARDAARWRAMRNWPYAQTAVVHGSDWPTWGPGTKFPEAGDVIDAWIDDYIAHDASIEREGKT